MSARIQIPPIAEDVTIRDGVRSGISLLYLWLQPTFGFAPYEMWVLSKKKKHVVNEEMSPFQKRHTLFIHLSIAKKGILLPNHDGCQFFFFFFFLQFYINSLEIDVHLQSSVNTAFA